MRTFVSYLLTIILFLVVVVTITVFTVGNLTSENSTREMLNNIDYDILVDNFKKTNYGIEIYNYANKYGISENRVDALLHTEEAKEYVNIIIQKGIDSYLNNEDIQIDNKTREFIDIANEKYNLNLNDSGKEELENYVNKAIYDNLNGNVNNNTDSEKNTSNQFLIDIIKICRDRNLHIALYIMTSVITLLLFFSSFKKKAFLEYIGIVSITVGISTLLFNVLISLLSDRIFTSLVNVSVLLLPVTNTFYIISFIGIILGIVLLIVQHFINKHVNKEVVPF